MIHRKSNNSKEVKHREHKITNTEDMMHMEECIQTITIMVGTAMTIMDKLCSSKPILLRILNSLNNLLQLYPSIIIHMFKIIVLFPLHRVHHRYTLKSQTKMQLHLLLLKMPNQTTIIKIKTMGMPTVLILNTCNSRIFISNLR
jgi:hypothetical protein